MSDLIRYIGRVSAEGRVIGTGFIVTPSGLIATCYHVLRNAHCSQVDQIVAFELLDGSYSTPIRVTEKLDAVNDLALLQAELAVPSDIAVPRLVRSSAAKQGIAFRSQGYGEPPESPTSHDYLSVIGNVVGPAKRTNGPDMLQLSSDKIAPGMSGSPVVIDELGGVVGIIATTYINSPEDTSFEHSAWAIRVEHLAQLNSAILQVVEPNAQSYGVEISSSLQAASTDIAADRMRWLTQQVDVLEARVADDIEENYQQARSALREGRPAQAAALVSRAREDLAIWAALTAQQKSRLIGLAALLEMSKPGGLQRAIELVEQARAIAPGANLTHLRALITFHQNGPKAALPLLDGLTDLESVNLRAALLLEDNRVDETLQLLATVIPTTTDPGGLRRDHAEALRVQALAFLAVKQVDQARLSIAKAMELVPSWVGVRYAAAVVDYFSVLSVAAPSGFLVSWPSPVDWDFIQRDDGSLERLRAAATTFHALDQENALTDEGSYLPIWYLACLANDPERQNAAIRYCGALLQENPANDAALMWAIVRRFDLDLEPSAVAIRKLLAEGKAGISHVTALSHFYLSTENPKEAVDLLEAQRSLYAAAGDESESGWRALHNLAQIVEGHFGLVLEELERETGEGSLLRIRANALERQARETQNWQPLLDHLDASYTATNDASFLLDACKLQGWLGNWDYVVNQTEILLSRVATASTVRLVVEATYSVRNHERCLELLDNYRHLFPHSTLPNDLRLLRALCLREVGIISEAISEAEAVALSDASTHNFLTLAQLYFDKGDMWRLASVARQIVARDDLTSINALRLADQLKADQLETAISLWRQAVKKGLSDDEVGIAVDLAFMLGRDREIGPLMARMMDLAKQGKGGVQIFDLKSLLELMVSRRQNIEEITVDYLANNYPIHLVAERSNLWLPFLYHNMLSANAATPDPINQSAILIRYGGHVVPPGLPDQKPQGRVLADVTSLLLAAHLEILDAVEQLFAPIYIPNNFIATLMHLRDQISPHQRSEPEEFKTVVDLFKRKSLKLAALSNIDEVVQKFSAEHSQFADELGEERLLLLAKAVKVDGYYVDFLPLHSRSLERPALDLPGVLKNRVINPRGVVDALWETGALSETEYKKALIDLGSQGLEPASGPLPPARKQLYLGSGLARSLASANVLAKLCEKFDVFIEQSDLNEARHVVDYTYGGGRELVDWLTALRDRISFGLDPQSGKYALLPTRSRGLEEGRHQPNPVEECLLSLMAVQTQPGDIVWVDDRLVTSYSLQGVAPIMGISEILKFLLSTQTITQETYYEKLYQLRAGNARFLPVELDEIVYHLKQAPVRQGKVTETPQLEVLRRYIAACQVPGYFSLERPSKDMTSHDRNPLGELPFLVTLRRAIVDAIGELWADDDLDLAEVRSDWIIDELYLEPADPFPAADRSLTIESEQQIITTHIAALLLQLMGINRKSPSEREAVTQRFSQWIWKRVLEPRTLGEQHWITMVAEVLKGGVAEALPTFKGSSAKTRSQGLSRRRKLGVRDNEHAKLKAAIPQIALSLFRSELPEAIRQEWDKDSQFSASLGVNIRKVSTFDDVTFESAAFVRAASKALRGDSDTVHTLKDEVVRVHPIVDNGRVSGIWFLHPISNNRVAIDADTTALGVLIDSVAKREAWLRERREWFDVDDAEFNKVVAQIASDEEGLRRVSAVNSWIQSNIAGFYDELKSRLDRHEHIRLIELVSLSAQGMLKHLRLSIDAPAGEGFAVALNGAAQLLVQECGVKEALRRLCGMPVPLPRAILDTLQGMHKDERRVILHTLLRNLPSPLTSVHILRILLLFQEDSPAYRRLAQRIVNRLTGEQGGKEFDAFTKLLRWLEVSTDVWEGSSSLPTHLKLALVWSHAHRLFALLTLKNIPLDWLPEETKPSRLRIPANLFARQDEYSRDSCDAFRLARAPVLLSALVYAIGDSHDTFVDVALQSAIVGATFSQVGDRIYPSLDLLYDISMTTNSMCSFLDTNAVEHYADVIGEEAAALLQPGRIQAEIVDTIAGLKATATNPHGWIALKLVVGDLMPAPPVIEALISLIEDVDFKELFAADLTTGVLAMHTAAKVSRFLQSESVQSHLERHLLEIATFLSARVQVTPQANSRTDGGLVLPQSNDSTEEGDVSADGGWTDDNLSSQVMEWAYYIALCANSEEDMTAKLADLLWVLVARWHVLLEKCVSAANNFAWTLPLHLGRPFWSLLVRLRTQKQD